MSTKNPTASLGQRIAFGTCLVLIGALLSGSSCRRRSDVFVIALSDNLKTIDPIGGYRTYRLYADRPRGPEARPGPAGTTGGTSGADRRGPRPGPAGTTGGGVGARAEPGGVVLESGRLRVRLDAASGWLGSLVAVGSGVELLPRAPDPHAVVLADPTDTWSHGALAYRDEIGAFACESVRVLEAGPVRAIVRAVSRYGASTLTEDLVLGSGGSLEVRATLDWHERLALLKLRVGTALQEVTASFDIPYGHLERPPDGGEEPAGAWVDLSGSLPGGRRAGLAILNDGKHAFDVLGGRVGMTVARSPVYAWHEPRQLDSGEDYRYLDQGVQRFTYRLLPHHGDWRAGGVHRGAAELNQLPAALVESCHPGPLEQRRAFVAVEPASVLLAVLKQAEDPGGALVVRAYESAGLPAPRVTIDLPLLGRRIETAFGAHQIKTFRVPTDPAAPAVETDLLERPLTGG